MKKLTWFVVTSIVCVAVWLGAVRGYSDEPLEWIWTSPDRAAQPTAFLRTAVDVRDGLRRATAIVVVDYAHWALHLNGRRLAERQPFDRPLSIDITDHLKVGENELTIDAQAKGPAALAARIDLIYADGSRQSIPSNSRWRAAPLPVGALQPGVEPRLARIDPGRWHEAACLGAVDGYRWGFEPDNVAIESGDDYTQWKRALAGAAATDPHTFQVVPGFTVDLVYSAAKGDDSWISLARDPRGRWIVGQEKQGLLRLTLPEEGQTAVKVERINDKLRECRGIVFAKGDLYAMSNVDNSLFRLRDTDGDDQFETVEKLFEFAGDAGHGRNQLTLGPDGNVWGICGDSVFEPASAAKLPPALRRPSRAEATRSGFVVRFLADGTAAEVVTRGLRNPYGLAFNAHGELFTYDADAEYDMGSAWYRPTRVNHLLPGADYGWRLVTTEWPPYFPDRADTPQPTLDIGKGSPTAVEFGAGDHFPPRYRQALYVLDWAYGRIVAVHMTPRGSSYQAAAETFLRGAPLNVTDLEFGLDGAMYFVTGGRGTQSGLYRVRYSGPRAANAAADTPIVAVAADASPQDRAVDDHSRRAREQRRALESRLSGSVAGADTGADKDDVDRIWPFLGEDDPWLRHAARVALEKVPVERWRERALRETDVDRALAARIALARCEGEAIWGPFSLDKAHPRQQLEMLYLAERAIAGESSAKELHEAIVAELLAAYPVADRDVNIEFSRVLSPHADATFTRKTLKLLDRSVTQSERMHYLFVLRGAPAGWSEESQRDYFEQLRGMDDYLGGEGMPTFRKLIRQQALESRPADDRPRLEALLARRTAPWQTDLPPGRTEIVKRWTIDELSAAWTESAAKADIDNGRRVFGLARCVVCHRCGGPGGVSGPDLTSVARRFSSRDLLASIVEPSRAIDEKYLADTFELNDGRVLTGRVAPGDYREPDLIIVPNLLDPDQTVRFSKSAIVRRAASPVSPMPTGLLDTLTSKEIADLVAFVLSAGSRSE